MQAGQWIAPSGGSLLSDIDDLGLVLPSKVFIYWKHAKVTTSSTSATTIYTFTPPSGVTTDMSVTVHYMHMLRGVGLATDNTRGQYNWKNFRRTGGTWTIPAGASGVFCQFDGTGTVTGRPTVTYVANGDTVDIKVTAADTNTQEHWMMLKFIGVYE